jgi:putative ABC transport system ATP-binding protein
MVITHEQEVADRAGRVVRMLDGRIVSDERQPGQRMRHRAPAGSTV